MPQSWWGKTLLWVYTIGYFIYFVPSAIATWSQMSFMSWFNFVMWESTYATVWPILLLLSAVGISW